MAERRHQHIIETTKTILHQAFMPPIFWSFACQQATFLINRLPTRTLHYDPPYQRLFGEITNYESIHTFGCLCYPCLKPYAKHKLEPKSTPSVYLGYSNIHHSHQCYDPISQKIYISRDIIFYENKFSSLKDKNFKVRVGYLEQRVK